MSLCGVMLYGELFCGAMWYCVGLCCVLLDCVVLGWAVRCQCLWCVRRGVCRYYVEHMEAYPCGEVKMDFLV